MYARYSCRVLFLNRFFEKPSNIKFHENPFTWVPSCSYRTDILTDGQTDKTQLTVASRNFVNPPKIQFTSDRELTASSLQINPVKGVYCTSHTKHINIQYGQNVALRNVKTGGTHIYVVQQDTQCGLNE